MGRNSAIVGRQREIHVGQLIVNVLCNFEHLLVEYQYMNVHVATYMYMWKVALHLRYSTNSNAFVPLQFQVKPFNINLE